MTETRRRYTKEFKLDAISLVEDQHYSTAEAARSLGINENMLRRWIRRHGRLGDEAFPGNGQPGLSPEQQRIRDLEKRVRELEMEKDILKKASAFFAKEMR